MKIYFFILLSLVSFIPIQNKSKLDLLCTKWRLSGIKKINEDLIPITDSVCTLTFKTNGTYEEQSRMYKANGEWKFTRDSTQLNLRMLQATGMHLPMRNMDDPNPSDSIIKLTQDTLIYRSKDYNYRLKISTYTDWHYSRYW